MSRWQNSHLSHDNLFNDMEDYDTDDEGYADFGMWLTGQEWKDRLAAVVHHTKTVATEEGLVDKVGRLHALADIDHQLRHQKTVDGEARLDIDEWSIFRREDDGRYCVKSPTSVGVGDSIDEAYHSAGAPVVSAVVDPVVSAPAKPVVKYARAQYGSIVDSTGKRYTLADIEAILTMREDNEGFSKLSIDNWGFYFSRNEDGNREYTVHATGLDGSSEGSADSVEAAYHDTSAPKVPASTTTSPPPSLCYDDAGNVQLCPDPVEHALPNGTVHRLPASQFHVFDGRMVIQASSITKNGHHWWQINVDRGNDVITRLAGLNMAAFESPFSDKAYRAYCGNPEEAKVEEASSLVDCFRDDLLTWFKENKDKTVREVLSPHPDAYYDDIANELMFIQDSGLQLELFMLTLKESHFGVMPYKVYAELKEEMDNIKRYCVVEKRRLEMKKRKREC